MASRDVRVDGFFSRVENRREYLKVKVDKKVVKFLFTEFFFRCRTIRMYFSGVLGGNFCVGRW